MASLLVLCKLINISLMVFLVLYVGYKKATLPMHGEHDLAVNWVEVEESLEFRACLV